MVMPKAIKIMKRYAARTKKVSRSSATTNTHCGNISSEKQLAFFIALPDDIVLEIFSYLNRQDCLTCMAVCSDWDKVIPEYTQHMWEELQICTHNVHMSHRRRERCLGSHVKSVTIKSTKQTTVPSCIERVIKIQDPELLYESLYKLKEWGCTKIQQLHLYNCRIPDPLNNAPEQLKLSLTRLMFTDNYFSISFLPRILNMCPAITHFTAEKESFFTGIRGMSTSAQSLNSNTKLKFLRLHIKNSEAMQLASILKRCPDLRLLITQYDTTGAHESLSINTSELNFIFTWCPKVTYLALGCNRNSNMDHAVNPDDYINDHVIGLRCLGTSNYKQFDQLIVHLGRNRNTLEQLFMYDWGRHDDYSTALKLIQLPQLRILSCQFDTTELCTFISLLNQCPILESLYWNPIHHTTPDVSAFLFLNRMCHLRKFDCSNMVFNNELSLVGLLNRLPMVEELGIGGKITLTMSSQLKPLRNLKTLTLGDIKWEYGDDIVSHDEAVAHFVKSLTKGTDVENIHFPLWQIFGIELLRAVALLPMITYIHGAIGPAVQDSEILEFINMLNGSAIRTLSLYNLKYLGREAFQALSYLKSLRTLTISRFVNEQACGTQIGASGLLDFLRICKNLENATFSYVYFEEGSMEFFEDAVSQLAQKGVFQYEINATPTHKTESGFSCERKLFRVNVKRSDTK